MTQIWNKQKKMVKWMQDFREITTVNKYWKHE